MVGSARPSNVPPTDPNWLALRTKHQNEWNEFNKRKEHDQICLFNKFTNDVNVYQNKLCSRQAAEEQAFWSKANARAAVGSGKAQIAPSVLPRTNQQHRKQEYTVPGNSSRASQLSGPAQGASSEPGLGSFPITKPLTPPMMNKGMPAFIDLCSDDEDAKDMKPSTAIAVQTYQTMQPVLQKPFTLPQLPMQSFPNNMNRAWVRSLMLIVDPRADFYLTSKCRSHRT